MSSAFAAAIRTVLRDPNLGRAAQWRDSLEDDAQIVPLRLVLAGADQITDGMGVELISASDVLYVAAAELADVPVGSYFVIGDQVLRVRAATIDGSRTTWRVECERA